MQTAVEWFWNEIAEVLPFTVDSTTAIKMYDKLQQAKEMEKQQIIKSWNEADNFPQSYLHAGNYYNETYGSKGSDETKTNSQRFDEFMQLVTSSQAEISDEEIEEASKYIQTTNPDLWTFKIAWKAGAKWYREQLKYKVNGNK